MEDLVNSWDGVLASGGGVVRRVLRGDRWLTPQGPETTTWVGCRLQRREPGLPDAVSSLSRCARLAGPAVSSGSALDDGPVGGPFECGQHVGEVYRPGQVDQGACRVGGHALHARNVAQPQIDFADTSAAGHPTDDQLDVVHVLAHLEPAPVGDGVEQGRHEP